MPPPRRPPRPLPPTALPPPLPTTSPEIVPLGAAGGLPDCPARGVGAAPEDALDCGGRRAAVSAGGGGAEGVEGDSGVLRGADAEHVLQPLQAHLAELQGPHLEPQRGGGSGEVGRPVRREVEAH